MSNYVSRRTVAKGAAWAVPAIAVAGAAPAMAASPGLIELSGAGCKLPGNSNSTFKGYAFALTASNTTTSSVTIQINSVTLNGEDLGDAIVVNLDTCTMLGTVNELVLPAGTSYDNLALLTSNAASSANGTLAVNYTVTETSMTDTVYASVEAAPPINGASCSTFTAAEKACLANF